MTFSNSHLYFFNILFRKGYKTNQNMNKPNQMVCSRRCIIITIDRALYDVDVVSYLYMYACSALIKVYVPRKKLNAINDNDKLPLL